MFVPMRMVNNEILLHMTQRNGRDIESTEIDDTQDTRMDGYSGTEDDDNLEKLTYKVLMDGLGVVNEAPSRLTMHDYCDLGLEGIAKSCKSAALHPRIRRSP
ncbi:uncharacterized protein N7503_002062 [Penicillium pulvis]|uniref:uncharacterized protein n=1 Tax=Penicillium pulvis TaxID=1562058 RepID=UPI00254879DE|nr:uncharacterized protein N7503_002062 [Penicillium pulvis]KAJ5809844.1 hypothetical protein N7503_002062 [Penicillium pulvis]